MRYRCFCWPGRELVIGGLWSKVRRASFLDGGKAIRFEQTGSRLVLKGLPRESPDKIASVSVIKLECATRPRHVLGRHYVVIW